MYCIYNILNTKNGRVYIGCSKNIKLRFKEHLNKLRKNKHNNIFLQRDWNKVGEEFFSFILLEECESEELMFEREKFLIETTQGLYNLASGGTGGNTTKFYTKSQKEKLSKKLSKIRKAYLRKHGTEHVNPFKDISKERREELLNKWSECKKGLKNSHSKYPQKIVQKKNGVIIKIWSNVYEAAEAGYTKRYVIGCCKGDPRYKTHKGFSWEFECAV